MPSSRHLALAGSLALGLCLIAVVSAATGSWAHVRSTAGGSHRFAVLAVLLAVGVVWLAIAARLAGADAARVVRHFGSVSLVTVGAVVLAAVAIGFVWQHPTSVPPPTRCQGVNLHSSRYSYCLGPGALLDCRQGSTNPACQFWCPMKLGVEFCPRVPGGGAAGAAGGRLRGGIDAALIEAALAGAGGGVAGGCGLRPVAEAASSNGSA
jgi:hypothetical protein